jgi:hypothetical protein
LTLISPPPPMIFIAASDMPCHDALLLTMFRLFSDAFSAAADIFCRHAAAAIFALRAASFYAAIDAVFDIFSPFSLRHSDAILRYADADITLMLIFSLSLLCLPPLLLMLLPPPRRYFSMPHRFSFSF